MIKNIAGLLALASLTLAFSGFIPYWVLLLLCIPLAISGSVGAFLIATSLLLLHNIWMVVPILILALIIVDLQSRSSKYLRI